MTDEKSSQLKLAIENIRKDFFNINEKNLNDFNENDLKRIRENDDWIRAYYWKQNHNEGLKCLTDALKWRKKLGVNNFLAPNPLPFPEEYLEKNAIFVKGVDKRGVRLMTLNVASHKKGVYPHDLLCKFIAYNLEKYYKYNHEHQIVMFFNMTDAGYSNMDMDLIKFVVHCLLYYYPMIAGYCLVYKMPFVFQAAWKVIKLMLPTALAEQVKFVDKTSIQEFMNDQEVLNDLH